MATAMQNALVQQGYDFSPRDLKELEWGLRFTPSVCMAGAVLGLLWKSPPIHFVLAGLGMLPFWFPAWHPVDRFYNHVLRPLWKGVVLPPNPLPRRIACFMGGAMNLSVAFSFLAGANTLAYVLGGMLIVLQMIVISTHFCVASWMYEGLLRMLGKWTEPVSVDEARRLLDGGAVLIDVRSPEEYAAGHLPDAKNVPLEQVVGVLQKRNTDRLVVYCKSGCRSQRAAQLLKRSGLSNVYNLGAMERLEESESR